MSIAAWIAVSLGAPFALGAITGLVHSAIRAARYLLDLLAELGEDTASRPSDLTITEMRKE
jgi:hypothetical protein